MILSKAQRPSRLLYQQRRGKAIQNWKRPSMDEMPGPTMRFEKALALNQTRNNTQLAFGVGALVGVLWWTQLYDLLPVSKRYDKVIKSLQPYRGQFDNFISEEQPLLATTPSLSVQYVNHEVKKEEHIEDQQLNEVKKSPNGIPEAVTYLIVGGGTASFGAYRSIKATDPTAKILIISEEKATPYMRPPLTKELWYFEKNHKSEGELLFKSFSGRERNLYFEKEAFYTPVDSIEFNDKGGIAVLKGVKVAQLIPDQNQVKLEDGRLIKYEKCLLATGGRPKVPKAFENFKDDPRVTTFRNVQDFQQLEKRIKSGQAKSVVIVGGGFLGTELAASLGIFAKDSKDIDLSISQILPEKGHLAKILPPYLSKWATKTLVKDGVQVHTESSVTSAESTNNNQIELRLDSGQDVIKADHVILAVGIDPATELAKDAGLPVDPIHGGFEVNEELKAYRDVYVAGDAASFMHAQHGRIRHEHHDNALVTGKIAGLNMTGEHKTVNVNSLFWSDLGNDVGLEGTGRIDSSLETVGVYAKTDDKDNEYAKGVVFYKDAQDVVVGVLLWNVFNHMSTARRIVNEHRKYEDLMEVAKLFNLYRMSETDIEGEQT